MALRFHDYPLESPARLAYAARAVGIGVAAGGGTGFLLALAASITVNEAFLDLWYEFDGDPISRALVPLLFVTLLAGLATYAVADSVYNWQLGSQLARGAALTPEDVPPHWQRAFVVRTKPLTGLNAVLYTVGGAGLLFALILTAIIGETSDDELTPVLSMLLGSVATAALCVGGAVLSMRVSAGRWHAVVQKARTVWTDTAAGAATRAEKQRRPQRREKIDPGRAYRALTRIASRGLTVGIAATLSGAAVGFLGVAIRQPCRSCDERSYGSFGEGLIDNLALVGAAVTALGILAFIAVALTSTVAALLASRALKNHMGPMATAGWSPSSELLHERLVGSSLAERLAIVVAGIGAAAITTAASFASVGLSTSDVRFIGVLWGGIALIVLAGILSFGGIGANLRMRGLLRERWAPGDVPTPPTAAKRARRGSR